MPPAPSLLPLDARESARALALDWLERVRVARAQLDASPDDPESVHDLRVAITRLRATLRLHADALATGIGERGAKALRRANRALGRVRDDDVQRAQLAALAETMSSPAREGAGWLIRHLAARRGRRLRAALATLTRELDPRLDRWQARLATYTITRTVGEATRATPFAALLAAQLATALGDVADSAAAARADARPDAAVHRLRLAVKRVRALLVPWLDAVPACAAAFRRATAAQDVIGTDRDAALLAHRVRRAVRFDPLLAEALHAVAEAVEAGRESLAGAVQADWIVDGAPALAALRAEGAAAVAAFEAIARDGHEIERKFLLRALPDAVRDVPGVRIAQGWLPGERLRERLRRSVHPDGRVEWTRTVKVGTGVARLELEEAADPVLFESLWPLTAAARIEKVRHAVPDGMRTWEIDAFLDRDLVLAEVELPDAETPVTPPAWLAPYVVREVTGDAAYVNANLARDRRDRRAP